MKRTPSAVWRFFDRIEENGRFVTVVCKLCEKEYKYCGNTTNLRCHLLNKHPIQWELGQNESSAEVFCVTATDDEINQATPRSRQKIYRKSTHSDDNVRYAISVDKDPTIQEGGIPIIKVDVLESETDTEHNDNEATINLVKHIQRGSDEEWLNDEVFETYETYTPPQKKRKMHRKMKREVTTPLPIISNECKPQMLLNNINDEYHSFGDYVSSKLKKLKNQQSRSNVQQLITTILWQAEYGMYDSIDTVKRILLHSMQDPGPSVQKNTSVVHDNSDITGDNIIGPTAD